MATQEFGGPFAKVPCVVHTRREKVMFLPDDPLDRAFCLWMVKEYGVVNINEDGTINKDLIQYKAFVAGNMHLVASLKK